MAASKPPYRMGLYRLTGEQELVIADVPHYANCLAFGQDGKTLVAGLADTTAVIWDLEAVGKRP